MENMQHDKRHLMLSSTDMPSSGEREIMDISDSIDLLKLVSGGGDYGEKPQSTKDDDI